ncbi:hypothetical protein CXIVA_18670 [Clostridium sp. SY8519]|uniref:hypothetical protein n=1 Tax=Clostridium sp. (strain SY8519) TaxID=1042156 RepID=UPI0002171F52|nr:hypothetical protein [Clostridium sp. SY8519]BAK47834.1 hypothetical protein CXIVA_18670 [Clostridium sp. SY8519]
MCKLIDITSVPVEPFLDLLLQDKSTKKNIIWATDTYQGYGHGFSDKEQINKKLLLLHADIIKPRIQKSQEEQAARTRKKAEVFTPKRVVKEMVDMLEKENPGCFDDPDATFADLYMKSGMYITEIVTRLFQSSRMKVLFPDDAERLNHIFAKQVYGCAPTEIIYRICLRYILGFSDEIKIEKNNIKLCDTLEYAKDGTLEENLEKLFG